MTVMTVASSYAEGDQSGPNNETAAEQAGDNQPGGDPSGSQTVDPENPDPAPGQDSSGSGQIRPGTGKDQSPPEDTKDTDKDKTDAGKNKSPAKSGLSKNGENDSTGDDNDPEDPDTDPIEQTLTASGDGYNISIYCPVEAGFPAGTRLVVKEKTGEEAAAYKTPSTAKIEGKDEIPYSRFFDISFEQTVEGETKKLEPEGTVTATFVLTDPSLEDDRGKMHIFWYNKEDDRIVANEVRWNESDYPTMRFDVRPDNLPVLGFLFSVKYQELHKDYMLEQDEGEILVSAILNKLGLSNEDLKDSTASLSETEDDVLETDTLKIEAVKDGDVVKDWKLTRKLRFEDEQPLTIKLANHDVIYLTLEDDFNTTWGWGNPAKTVKWRLNHAGDTMTFFLSGGATTDEEKAIRFIRIKEWDHFMPTDDEEKPFKMPWDTASGVTKVVIQEGITGIGWKDCYDTTAGNQFQVDSSYRVFKNCTDIFNGGVNNIDHQSSDKGFRNLTTVVPCSTIQRIGWSAFKDCPKLIDIDFSAMPHLKEILKQSFQGTPIANIDMSSNTELTAIWPSAFYKAKSLSTVKLPGSIQKIGANAFETSSKMSWISNEGAKKKALFREAGTDKIGSSYWLFPKATVIGSNAFKGLPSRTNAYKQLTATVYSKTSGYNGKTQYGYTIVKTGVATTNQFNVSGLVSPHVLYPSYTPASGRLIGPTYKGSWHEASCRVVNEEDGYDYLGNYVRTFTPGTLEITTNDKVTVKIWGYKKEVVYNGTRQTVTGYRYKASDIAGDVAYTKKDFTYRGSDIAARENTGTSAMHLDKDDFDNINDSYRRVTFVVVDDGSITVTRLPVNVMITGHEGADTYDGNQHTTEGFEFSANTPLYKRSDFIYTGSVSATREDFGITGMNLSPRQFININNNFTASFSVNDGHQKINPDAVRVTIIGHTATDGYDGDNHTVEGFEFKASNPLYKRSDFTFTGQARADREDVGTSQMGLSLGQFKNVSKNFDATFTIIDGSQTITLISGRAGNMFAANLANRIFPGGGLYLTSNDHWGLLNLVFMIVTILIGLWSVIWRNFRDSEEPLKFSLLNEVISALPAVLSVALFFLTENPDLPMKIFDQWTFVMGLFTLVEWTIVYMMKMRAEDDSFGNVMRV